MRGAGDHFLLHSRKKPCEIVAVSADAYNKIGVFFRMRHCIAKNCVIHYVYLPFKTTA